MDWLWNSRAWLICAISDDIAWMICLSYAPAFALRPHMVLLCFLVDQSDFDTLFALMAMVRASLLGLIRTHPQPWAAMSLRCLAPWAALARAGMKPNSVPNAPIHDLPGDEAMALSLISTFCFVGFVLPSTLLPHAIFLCLRFLTAHDQ